MTEEEQTEVLDVLFGVLMQACGLGKFDDPGYHFDSMALSFYADGIRMLAKHGLVRIESEYGRRVIAVPMSGGGAKR